MVLAAFFGILIGAVLGVTGAGGSIFAVPALMLGLGFSIPQATPIALMAVAAAALLGSFDGLRRGLVRYKAALLMAVFGAAATPLGISIAHRVPHDVLVLMFSLVLVTVASRMILQGVRKAPASQAHLLEQNCMLNPDTAKLRWNMKCAVTLAAVGSASGVFTGMLGVGGGFLVTPAFKHFSNVGMHGVVATSLLVVALVSTSAAVGAVIGGAHIPPMGWVFVGAAVVGMFAGRWAAPSLPPRWLQAGFGLLATVAAAILLWKTFLSG